MSDPSLSKQPQAPLQPEQQKQQSTDLATSISQTVDAATAQTSKAAETSSAAAETREGIGKVVGEMGRALQEGNR